jgi:predicted Zn-ribbon and HTH transcriptional regulator
LKKKGRVPLPPPERKETIRQAIVDLLATQPLSAKEISGHVRIPEKEVHEHLKHIQKTIHKKNSSVKITPPRCKQCGFEFTKREKFKKPGKCPVCKGETIEEARFVIKP